MYGHTVKSPYKGHCGDLELLSSLARVRNCGSLFQPNICTFFAWGLAAVRIIVVVRYSEVSARRELTVFAWRERG